MTFACSIICATASWVMPWIFPAEAGARSLWRRISWRRRSWDSIKNIYNFINATPCIAIFYLYKRGYLWCVRYLRGSIRQSVMLSGWITRGGTESKQIRLGSAALWLADLRYFRVNPSHKWLSDTVSQYRTHANLHDYVKMWKSQHSVWHIKLQLLWRVLFKCDSEQVVFRGINEWDRDCSWIWQTIYATGYARIELTILLYTASEKIRFWFYSVPYARIPREA